ncbi:hypothetical protein AB6A40_005318 [Gnathostoma spinigerum]|uniref:Uncharacterized protein n=1 Tax=Gnathostoma spinigerum TaxID=75299 RepID=A0ABD6EKC4_9BILA
MNCFATSFQSAGHFPGAPMQFSSSSIFRILFIIGGYRSPQMSTPMAAFIVCGLALLLESNVVRYFQQTANLRNSTSVARDRNNCFTVWTYTSQTQYASTKNLTF